MDRKAMLDLEGRSLTALASMTEVMRWILEHPNAHPDLRAEKLELVRMLESELSRLERLSDALWREHVGAS